jgi:hypothetical protein
MCLKQCLAHTGFSETPVEWVNGAEEFVIFFFQNGETWTQELSSILDPLEDIGGRQQPSQASGLEVFKKSLTLTIQTSRRSRSMFFAETSIGKFLSFMQTQALDELDYS